MVAICNGTDLSDYVAQGYEYTREPQYGGRVTAIDGTDYSAKLRDIVKLTVPFIPLTEAVLTSILQQFPTTNAYVEWTYYDPYLGENRTAQMMCEPRTTRLRVRYSNGVELWDGLVLNLTER